MKTHLNMLAIGSLLAVSLSTAGCASEASDTSPDEDTAQTREALPISTVSGGINYKCSETSTGGGCTCDASAYMDCKGMSTYCKNNGGTGTVTCAPGTSVCVCSY